MSSVVNPKDENVTSLVRDIMADAQKLAAQEWELAKAEITKEYTRARDAAVYFAIAGAVGAIATVLFFLGVAHWISWMFPDFPLWGSYLALALIMGIAAGFLFWSGKEKVEKVHLVPERTIETVKETLTWNQT